MKINLFNTKYLSDEVEKFQLNVVDNSAIFLKWHNDNQKEEALQADFLNDIFGKVLGYEIDTGKDEFNLLKELKTQKDGTKPDGSLGFYTKTTFDTRVVVELKDKKTKNLDEVEKQAFEYRDKIGGIEWVITSNTNEIRLYSAKSGGRLRYHSWLLKDLAESLQKQKEFAFLLSKNRLITKDKESSPVHKLIEANLKEEELIKNNFYKIYKTKRLKLIDHIKQINPNINAIQKSQKLLDRLLFVRFCVDRGYISQSSVQVIENLVKFRFTFYQTLKILFETIDKGSGDDVTKDYEKIIAWNGGLFAQDKQLDDLELDSEILREIDAFFKSYNFSSQIDVNILGHIFEQSITDLEKLENGENFDIKQGKRKKDGVFYTPEYITKYIVEQAVGSWLLDRKTELNEQELPAFSDEELDILQNGKKIDKILKEKAQKHFDFYNNLSTKLSTIKVVDPACGSGAFLVEVFHYLEKQWQTVNEKISHFGKIIGVGSLLEENHNYKDTLKNNIYGVDINFESTQITRLSLWIQTAHNKTALVSLDNNIKCGNSLIDDPKIAGDKAFNWQTEFPQVFTQKKLSARHLIFATHNSRYSQRMIDNGVQQGSLVPWQFDEEQEIVITEIIADIATENTDLFRVINYNICIDHIHMLLICDEADVPKIMQTIKGKSAKLFNDKYNQTGVQIWAQKYSDTFVKNDYHLDEVIRYISDNRYKHNLPPCNKGFQPLVSKMCGEFYLDYNKGFKPLVDRNSGFDVVVGNPPYVSAQNMNLTDREFLKNNYNFLQDKWDIYVAFIEKAINLIKEGAMCSYIIPDAFVREKYSSKIRDYIANNLWMKKINFLEQIKVFENVGVSNIIFVMQKTKTKQETENIVRTGAFENITIKNNIEAKNATDSVQLGDICFISVGMVLNADENKAKGEFIKNDIVSNFKTNIHTKPIIEGDCLDKYVITNNRFLEWDTERVPHKIRRPTFPELHVANKIVINKIGTIKASYDNVGFACEQTVRVLILWKQLNGVENQSINNSLKRYSNASRKELEDLSSRFEYFYLLAIINSKYCQYFFNQLRGYGSIDINPLILRDIPIPKISNKEQQPFIQKAQQMLDLTKQLSDLSSKFLKLLSADLGVITITKKLNKWYNLQPDEFFAEVYGKGLKPLVAKNNNPNNNKGFQPLVNKTIALSQKSQWLEHFEKEKEKILDLQKTINTTDSDIDKMVYKLYNLTDEEIKIIETRGLNPLLQKHDVNL